MSRTLLNAVACAALLHPVAASAADRVLPAPGAPIIEFGLHNDRRIDVGQCLLSCFDGVYSYSTPAYYTFDTPHNVTLVYNSRTAHPRPYVFVDAQAAASGPIPDMFSLSLQVNGWYVQPLGGQAPIWFAYADASRPVARLMFQFDGSGLPTGRYPITAEVTAWSGGVASPVSVLHGHILIVNEANSPFGAGWNVAGVQRLHLNGNDAVITEGDGSAVHFQRACVSCDWTAPDGEFSTFDYGFGSNYQRVYPDGSRAIFNAQGQMTSLRNRHSVGRTYQYASGLLTSITDPASSSITLSYAGGLLQSITDPGGRGTTVQHSGSHLQQITFAGQSETYVAPGVRTVLQACRLGDRTVCSANDS